jgi:DHA2 family multidrug resistance protein
VITLALIVLVVRESEAAVEEQRQWRLQKGGFDVVGFLLVATFLGSLQIVLDRGLEDDWFGSSFITTVAIVCALAFVLMIPGK